MFTHVFVIAQVHQINLILQIVNNKSTCTKGELIDFNDTRQKSPTSSGLCPLSSGMNVPLFRAVTSYNNYSVFTISYGEDTCVINPGQLVECSWMNEVMVDNIE